MFELYNCKSVCFFNFVWNVDGKCIPMKFETQPLELPNARKMKYSWKPQGNSSVSTRFFSNHTMEFLNLAIHLFQIALLMFPLRTSSCWANKETHTLLLAERQKRPRAKLRGHANFFGGDEFQWARFRNGIKLLNSLKSQWTISSLTYKPS